MKKKLISVLAAVMVLSFGTTAFAATSPTTVDTKVEANAAQTTVTTVSASKTVAEYAAVEADTATVSATSQDVINSAVATVNELTKDVAALADKYISGNAAGLKAAALDASKTINVDVKMIADVKGTPGTPVTFKVAGITANSCVLVLHWNGSAWEAIPATVGEGTVTATFNSFSPVAIVEFGAAPTAGGDVVAAQNAAKEAAATTAAATPAADATAVASPKTGAAMPVVAVIAAISAAGAVVCTKKAKLN